MVLLISIFGYNGNCAVYAGTGRKYAAREAVFISTASGLGMECQLGLSYARIRATDCTRDTSSDEAQDSDREVQIVGQQLWQGVGKRWVRDVGFAPARASAVTNKCRQSRQVQTRHTCSCAGHYVIAGADGEVRRTCIVSGTVLYFDTGGLQIDEHVGVPLDAGNGVYKCWWHSWS